MAVAAFNFIAVRRDEIKKSKEKGSMHRTREEPSSVLLYSRISATFMFFLLHRLWQPVGSLIFHRSVPRHIVPILESAGINELPIFAAPGRRPLRFNERDLIAPRSSLTPQTTSIAPSLAPFRGN